MSRIMLLNATAGREVAWRRIRIHKSLDDICHTLEAEIAPSERLNIHRHDKLEVRYVNPLVNDSGGKRRVTTVLVDEVTEEADARRHAITAAGRSPARDIIDSSWSEDYTSRREDYKGITLLALVRAIGKKFNIACDTFPTNKGDPTGIVNAFRIENESPWAKLSGEADNQGYIFTGNEAGGLYLWKAAALSGEAWGFHLTEGVNIKSLSRTENGSEQYNTYIVTGGCKKKTVTDPSCPAGRVRTIDITKPDISETELGRRAQTEMKRRRETRVTVSVPGWGLSDGQIKRLGDTDKKEIFYTPNLLIPVKCPSIGLDAKLLIAEVEYEASPEGFGCTVTAVNKEAYQ
jgi:prophage tail gpP-like protein